MVTKKVVKSKRIPVNKKRPMTIPDTQTIPLMLYRRMAVVFLVLVAGALFAVLYLATMQAVITVTSIPKELTTDFVVKTVDVATTDQEVQGEVLTGMLGRTKTMAPQSVSTKEIPEQATGTVTITNRLSSAQPLVATTRLLSESGVLFRLKEGVTVPAGGSVDAVVFADQKGATGNIGPTTFTIPGLNEAKQSQVTAESTAPMSGGVRQLQVLTQEALDQLIAQFEEELMTDARAMLREQKTRPYAGEAFFVQERTVSTNANAGDEVTEVDISLELTVSGVFYDDEAIQKLAQRKLTEALGQGQTFIDDGAKAREVEVQQVNVEQGAASLRVHQVAKTITSQTSKALEVGRFVGMSESEVRDVLITEGVATDVDVQFFPFWVRTVPRLKDHIYVEIR